MSKSVLEWIMARLVVLTHNNQTYSLPLTKVDRGKLYGTKKRVPLDEKGRICSRSSLTADGKHLLKSGMTAQGYFTSNDRLVSRSEMVGIDQSGNIINTKPSTLGEAQDLVGPVSFEEILDLALESVFYLGPSSGAEPLAEILEQGVCFKFAFNYTAGLEVELAYLVLNEDGFFALVGKEILLEWIDEGTVFVADLTDDDEDDLDFESL